MLAPHHHAPTPEGAHGRRRCLHLAAAHHGRHLRLLQGDELRH